MKEFQTVIYKFLKNHEKHKKYLALLTVLSLVVSMAVPFSLIMPAISMTGSLSCGMEEHTHSDDCYELYCGQEESDEHLHNQDCYALVCDKPEHIHTQDCYASDEEDSDSLFEDIFPDAMNINNVADGNPWFTEVATEKPNGSYLISDISGMEIKIGDQTYNKEKNEIVVLDDSVAANFKLSYSIPASAVDATTPEGNRYIYYQLPDGVIVNEERYGPFKVVTDGSIDAGYYSINRNGLIVIRLTDEYITAKKETTTLIGNIEFNGTLGRDDTASGDRTLAFDDVHFDVQFPDKAFGLTKESRILSDLKDGKPQIEWTITVDNEFKDAGLKGWILTDKMLTCDQNHDHVNNCYTSPFPANGTGVTVVPSNVGTFDADGNFTFTADSYSERYTTFKYITSATGYDGSKDVSFNNTAKLSKGNNSISAPDDETINKTTIKKEGHTDYENGNLIDEKVYWDITVENQYGINLNGYSVSDIKLVGAKNVKVKDAAGNELGADDFSHDSQNGIVTINKNINGKCVITYTQDISLEKYTDKSSNGTSLSVYKDITNTAYLKKGSIDVDHDDETIRYEKKYKLEKQGVPDYNTGTAENKVNWTINVENVNGSNLAKFEIEDEAFGQKTTTNIVVKDDSGNILANGSDYTISGNIITISENSKIKKATITYTTDVSSYEKDQYGKKSVPNTVKFRDPDKKEFTQDTTVEYENKYTLNKEGTYDRLSNKIKWTVTASTDQNNKKIVLHNYTLKDSALAGVSLKDIDIITNETKFNWDDLEIISQNDTEIQLGYKNYNNTGSPLVYATISKSVDSDTITINSAVPFNGSNLNNVRGLNSITFSYETPSTATGNNGLTATTENNKNYISNGIGDNRGNNASGKVETSERHEFSKKLISNSSDTIQIGSADKGNTEGRTKILDWQINITEDGGFSKDSKVLVDTMKATNGAEHYLNISSQATDIKIQGRAGDSGDYKPLTSDLYEITYKDKDGKVITSGNAVTFEIRFKEGVDSTANNYRYIKIDYKTTADYSGIGDPEGANQVSSQFSNEAEFNGQKSPGQSYEVILNDKTYVKPVTVNVSKKWVGDEEASRPSEIKIQLQRREGTNGTWKTIYKNADNEWTEANTEDTSDYTFTLNSSNSWSISWNDLPSETDDHSKKYYYKAKEVQVPDGYEVSYPAEIESGNYEITNTKLTDFTKSAIDKTGKISSEIDVKNLDKVTVNGTEYYAIGWRLDFTTFPSSTIYINDTFGTADDGSILLTTYTKNEKDSNNAILTYPAFSTTYNNSGYITTYWWSMNPNMGSNSGYSYQQETKSIRFKLEEKVSSLVYYIGIPVSELNGKLELDSYYISNNEAEIENGISKQASVIITGSAGGDVPSESQLLQKNVNNTKDQSFIMNNGYAKYSVYVNPDGKILSNTNEFDVTDIFNINSLAGISDRFSLDVELKNVNIQEIGNIKKDENGNIISAKEIRPVNSSYLVNYKPKETVELNLTSSYSDSGSIKISDAENKKKTFPEQITITFEIEGTPNTTWTGQIDGQDVTLSFDSNGKAEYQWIGILGKTEWGSTKYNENYAKDFPISNMTDSTTGASIKTVSVKNVSVSDLNLSSEMYNNGYFNIKDGNTHYKLLSENFIVNFKMQGTPNAMWKGKIDNENVTFNFDESGYASYKWIGKISSYNYEKSFSISSISGWYDNNQGGYFDNINNSVLTGISVEKATVATPTFAVAVNDSAKLNVTGIGTVSEPITMILKINGTPNTSWSGKIGDESVNLNFDSNGNAQYEWTGTVSGDSKEFSIAPRTTESSQVIGASVSSASYVKSTPYANAEVTFTVPDETPLKITYEYYITKNGLPVGSDASTAGKNLSASNAVSLKTKNVEANDEKNDTIFYVNTASADISGDQAPYIFKYDVGSVGKGLQATFLIAKYKDNKWQYADTVTPTNDSTGKFIANQLTFNGTLDNAVEIQTGEDGIYKILLEKDSLYMIAEIKAPSEYEGNGTFTINGTSYNDLESLMRAYISASDKTVFEASEYGSLIKSFIHYFCYDTTNITIPQGLGVSADDVINVQSKGSLNITNNKLIDISAEKKWSESLTGISATVELWCSNRKSSSGIPVNAKRIDNSEQTVSGSEKAEWKDLPNGKNGDPIYYYVKETKYTVNNKTYKLDTDGNYYEWNNESESFVIGETGSKIEGDYKPTYTGNALNNDGTISILNSKGLSLKKVWKNSDGSDMDRSIIPETPIRVQVKATGNGVPPVIKILELSNKNDWQTSLDNVTLNIAEGYDISQYTSFDVTELNKPYNYVVSIMKNLTGSVGEITLVNKDNTPTKVNVNVEKSWSDGNSLHDNDSISVKLYKSSRILTNKEITALGKGTLPADNAVSEVTKDGEVTLNKDKQWKHTWTNLDYKGENVQRYFYYPVETLINLSNSTQRYITSYSRLDYDASQNIVIKNTVPSKFTINKQWTGSDNLPEKITVELYRRAELPVTQSQVDTSAAIKIMPIGDSITYGEGGSSGGSYRKYLYYHLKKQFPNVNLVGKLSWTGEAVINGENVTYDAGFVGNSGYAIKSYQYNNQSRPGIYDNIIESAKEWENAVKEQSPDIVLLMIGTNDIMDNYEMDNIKSRLKELVDEIYNQKNNVKLYIMSPPPINSSKADFSPTNNQTLMNDNITSYITEIKSLIQEEKNAGRYCEYLDINTLFSSISENPKYGYSDYKKLLNDYCHPNEDGYAIMGEFIAQELLSDLGVSSETTELQKNISGLPTDFYNADGSVNESLYEHVNDYNITPDGDNWSLNLEDLAKTDTDGNEYIYYIKEKSMTGWTPSYKNNGQKADSTQAIEITNTKTTPKTDISVEKVWRGTALDSITVQLYKAGLNASEEDWQPVDGKTLTLNQSNSWKGVFADLEQSDSVYYYVKETSSTSGYDVKYSNNIGHNGIDTDTDRNIVITNIQLGGLNVEKGWLGENGDESKRPDSVKVNVYRSTTAPDGSTPAVARMSVLDSMLYAVNMTRDSFEAKTIEFKIDDFMYLSDWGISGKNLLSVEFNFVDSDVSAINSIGILDNPTSWSGKWHERKDGISQNTIVNDIDSTSTYKSLTVGIIKGGSVSIDSIVFTYTDGTKKTVTKDGITTSGGGGGSSEETTTTTTITTTTTTITTTTTAAANTTTAAAETTRTHYEQAAVPNIPAGLISFETLEITSASGWTASLDNLPLYDENGNRYYYYIQEVGSDNTLITETGGTVNGNGVKYIPVDYINNGTPLGDNPKIVLKNWQKPESSESTMPSTGGKGTEPYKVTGLLMACGAITILAVKRRRKKA